MSLTQKQEAFALAYFETGNASEAYRRSYNAANMSDPVVHNKASGLLAKGEVRVRIAELNASAASSAVMTLTDCGFERDEAGAGGGRGGGGSSRGGRVLRGIASSLPSVRRQTND